MVAKWAVFSFGIRFEIRFEIRQALQEYLGWLKGGHVQAVVAGGAVSGEVRFVAFVVVDSGACIAADGWSIEPLHLVFEQVFRHDGDELKVTSSYVFPSREAFRTYEETVAPGLRADGVQRFSSTGKAVAFQRSLGEIVFQS